MTFILGINACHADASACLLRNGALVAGAEEERFKRIKHWAGVPLDAIRYCLSEAKITLRDVSVISINSNPGANLARKILYTAMRRPNLRLLSDRLKSRANRRSLPTRISTQLEARGFDGEVHFIEHHLAHLASAFFASPYDSALALSVDGFGDFASTAWGRGDGNELKIDGKVHFPHSLGIFYETITHFLGFKRYGDEYKVMGLAPYGKLRYEREMGTLVELKADGRFALNLEYFNHHHGSEVITWDDCEPVTGDYFTAAFEELLGAPRSPDAPVTQAHMDIARSAQAMYERAFYHVLRHLHAIHRLDTLVLSGGCASNSVANGKIYGNTPIRSSFIQAAAGDAGGALGAALYSWHVRMGEKRSFSMDHAYWGPGYSDDEIVSRIEHRREKLIEEGCRWGRVDPDLLLDRVASAIAEGKVVGWFQGRMEWGSRALGNRSILCDPRRGDMKEILNAKIKHREQFRPFAPAILREYVSEWFEIDDNVPFMMKVFPIRDEQRSVIPAVTHVDGSGRLQTVEKHQNPTFYGLIEKFKELTGVPLLLNTSFNQNEPIVCTVDEAVDCFLRTHMDMLVIGDHIISRENLASGDSRVNI